MSNVSARSSRRATIMLEMIVQRPGGLWNKDKPDEKSWS